PGCNPDVDCGDHTGTALVQAATIMHEIGHNLNLLHAGVFRTPNCMPNYPSVMNYLYQIRGLTGSDNKEYVDFSNGRLLSFDEAYLPEALRPMGAQIYKMRFYGPPLPSGEGTATKHCDGTSIDSGPLAGQKAVRLEAPNVLMPDWNRNGKVDPPYPF